MMPRDCQVSFPVQIKLTKIRTQQPQIPNLAFEVDTSLLFSSLAKFRNIFRRSPSYARPRLFFTLLLASQSTTYSDILEFL